MAIEATAKSLAIVLHVLFDFVKTLSRVYRQLSPVRGKCS